jgi:3-deoxy-D-arabino-heptulosonate 7-phosphate (DAHP) synthase class II
MEQEKKREHMNDYNDTYQPRYPDSLKLAEALRELENTEAPSTLDHIFSLRADLQELAIDKASTPFITVGPCAEHVSLAEPIHEIAEGYAVLEKKVAEILPSSIRAIRGCGQSAKPRSHEMDGGRPSYYGDMINSKHADRIPDPSRMVAAALQSRDIQEHLTTRFGRHIHTSHEALLLPYEESFKKQTYTHTHITSGDMLWIGERTRKKGSRQVELLHNTTNAIGVKLGPSVQPDDIVHLNRVLNHQHEPGKLSFIFRFGLHNISTSSVILDAISRHAPHSLIICDPCHGNTIETTNTKGKLQKTRVVEDMIQEVIALSDICRMRGMKLHGLHLEAVAMRPSKRQCVDYHGDLPSDVSDVDPQLNLIQLEKILTKTKEYLL